jgi:hypothetical protein
MLASISMPSSKGFSSDEEVWSSGDGPEEEGDLEDTAAAWLHDVIEDTTYEYVDVENEIGPDVAALVWELSNRFTKEAYPSRNRAARKSQEVERIYGISKWAKLIKLADRLDNLRTVRDFDEGFGRLYLDESVLLLEALRGVDTRLWETVEREIKNQREEMDKDE